MDLAKIPLLRLRRHVLWLGAIRFRCRLKGLDKAEQQSGARVVLLSVPQGRILLATSRRFDLVCVLDSHRGPSYQRGMARSVISLSSSGPTLAV